MLNRVATKISKHLLVRNIINQEVFDIYVYGLELLLSSVFSTSVVLVVGAVLGQLLETIAFLITFILLRSFTGGYHAKTYLFCSIVTFSSFGSVLLLSNLLNASILGYGILSIVGLLILLLVAPVENPNKKLTHRQKNRFKMVSITLFFVLILIGIATIQSVSSVSNVIFFALIADLFLLFIKNKKERRTKNEVC